MAPPAPLLRSPLRARIHAVVREQIVRGELAPGAPVRDAELAAALGASRTPVREALVQLASEGLLISHAGRGFEVPPLSRREVEEAQPLISALEPLALQGAPPPTRAQERELERLARRMAGRVADAARWNELDTAWHRCLIARCPNARLLRYIEELRDVLRRYELAYLSGLDDMQLSATEHRAIAAAFAAGERERAVSLLRAHWQRGEDELLSVIPEETDT